MTDIFLSYSSKDRDRVRPIRDALVAAGYDVFWDQETPTGVNWNRWILERLAQARVVIVAWSRNSVASDPVIHEASIAREDGKLLPCLLQTLTARDMPMGFYMAQAAALYDWTGQAGHGGFLDLTNAVHARLLGAGASLPTREGRAVVEPDLPNDIGELRRCANAGDACAQTALGKLYFTGEGVLRNDGEAVRLFRLAAEQSYAEAQSSLALMYELGRGVMQDDEIAAKLYWLAANNGNAEAQTSLAVMLDEGFLDADFDTLFDREAAFDLEAAAMRLLTAAADQGHAHALFLLGQKYGAGRVVPKDTVEELRYYLLAADQNDPEALQILANWYEKGICVAKDEAKSSDLRARAAVNSHKMVRRNHLKLSKRRARRASRTLTPPE